MKREYIIGGCIGLVFIIAIIVCIVVNKVKKPGSTYTPTVAKIISIDENDNVKEEEFKVKLENDDKTKLKEYTDKIEASINSGDKYGMSIICDYVIHINENTSIRFKSNIKEYIEYIDETKDGFDKKTVTRAPDGFIDWVLEHIKE